MPKLLFPYIDYQSQYVVSMTPEHHLRQLGGAYVWSYVGSIASGGTLWIEIQTPVGAVDEFAWKPAVINSDQIIRMDLYEAPTITTHGTTEIPAFNQNRLSDRVAVAKLYSNPSGVSGGVLLRSILSGGGSISSPFGAETVDMGWQFKMGISYVLKISNLAGQVANNFNIVGQLYEIKR